MDMKRGLYKKFNVTRADGSSGPGGKHEGCRYYVLDLTHDPFSVQALEAYAKACKEKFPLLHDDLMDIVIGIIAQQKVDTVEQRELPLSPLLKPAPSYPPGARTFPRPEDMNGYADQFPGEDPPHNTGVKLPQDERGWKPE